MERYLDRRDAGRKLGKALAERLAVGRGALVLALPRGGVPVAYEVARALAAPLDVFVVRKLGVPGQEELAMGAIAAGGVRVMNADLVEYAGVSREAIDAAVAAEERELSRRERLYRGSRPPVDAAGREVVIVDDGLATGASMRAAVKALRAKGAKRIVVAVPVGASATCRELARDADDVYCLRTPEPLYSVGQWYEDFAQTGDDEVSRLLEAARHHSDK
jgi:predicted phosphoribosyltransferase